MDVFATQAVRIHQQTPLCAPASPTAPAHTHPPLLLSHGWRTPVVFASGTVVGVPHARADAPVLMVEWPSHTTRRALSVALHTGDGEEGALLSTRTLSQQHNRGFLIRLAVAAEQRPRVLSVGTARLGEEGETVAMVVFLEVEGESARAASSDTHSTTAQLARQTGETKQGIIAPVTAPMLGDTRSRRQIQQSRRRR